MRVRLLRYTGAWLVVLALFGTASSTWAQVVEPLGGPYTVDANTMLLLQFDDDFSNATDRSGDAIAHGNAMLIEQSARPTLGGSLYLKNDARSDSSWVEIPDSDALDLAGDWTIELWFQVLTYGTSNEDHRWVPVLMWKKGDTTFDQGNYFMEIWGNTRSLSTGFSVPGHGWPNVASPQNLIRPGEWYHATLIRDTEHAVLVQMIHDADLNLVWSGASPYDPINQAIPNITESPLVLGNNNDDRAVQSGWLDGFMDEIRISNIVRNFAVPPVIRDVEGIANQSSQVSSYPAIRTTIAQIGGSPVGDVTLRYKAGAMGDWQDVTMAAEGDGVFAATVPTQDPNTIVYYYVSAENDAGQRMVYPSNAEDQAPTYLSFAVMEGEAQTLALDFESGAGTPIDQSPFGTQIVVHGLPEYSTDAAAGAYALELNGETDYLEAVSPAIGDTEEFTLDFWLKPNTLDGFWRFIVNKPALSPPMWGENTFEIISGAFDDPSHRLTAGVWSQEEGNTRITLPISLEMENWYRVMFEVRKAPAGDVFNYYAIFQLRDENDEVLGQDYKGFNVKPTFSQYPMRIGKAGGDRPYFDGKFDEVNFYNYAQAQIAIDAPPNVSEVIDLANQAADVQEYPEVSARIVKGLGSDVSTAKLHYMVDGEWSETAMSASGEVYSASIPKQDAYSVVYYYVSAENQDGLRAVYPADAESETSPVYLSFAVVEPNTQTLNLTFDEGTGTPIDHSPYGNLVTVQGDPKFTTEAAAGSHAIALDGDGDFIEIHSPLFESEEFTFDFWMKANNLDGFWRFIANKPAIVPPFWGENTFEVITGAFDDPQPKITAGIWSHAGGNTRVTVPAVLETGAWYRVIVEVQKAPESAEGRYYLVAQVRDASGAALGTERASFDERPSLSMYPLRLGKAGGDRPYFDGYFDEVRFYNHAQAGLAVSIEDAKAELPQSATLYQNYPNPFNPSTKIAYDVPSAQNVRLEIFDLLGRKVATLVDSNMPAGRHEVRFDASRLSSGVYLYRLETATTVHVRTMLLVK
jgi:hypothetical protein